MTGDPAPLMGVSREIVYAWMRGASSPTVRQLDKMCEVLGVRRDDIELGGSKE